MNDRENYDALLTLSKRARTLEGVTHHLDWDQETYMPFGAAGIRAEQMKILAGLIHEIRTGTPFRAELERLVDLETGQVKATSPDARQSAALREWRRDFTRATALPQEFVEEFAAVSSHSIVVWREARKNNDFAHFAPTLQKIVDLNRRKAEYIGYEDHPYDALVDEYEPGVTVKLLDALFGRLAEGVTPLLKRIAEAPQVEDSFLFGDFDHDKQIAFGRTLLDAMGFDWNRGRLDISTHPFCSTPHPTDCRVTSRIHPKGLMSYQLSALHEGGHALYEQNLPQENYGSPLGDAISLGMHEANSRWWETRIGLTRPFWSHFYPELQRHFPEQLHDISLDAFYRAINRASPSLIRVEADEVTYPLHIILRYQLEKQLIEGTLEVDLLPAAWNEKMKELLDIVPPTVAEGCLQDIHWSMGAFGYFPTYTLGTLYAATLFKAFEKDHPTWEEEVAQGKLGFINDWLHARIHQFGREYTSLELIQQITGAPFSEEPFLSYLHDKYSAIYAL